MKTIDFHPIYQYICTIPPPPVFVKRMSGMEEAAYCGRHDEGRKREQRHGDFGWFRLREVARRADGIVTVGLVGYGTSILDGANNTAKVIKRIGYGFQDFEYFALKLKSAFPGRRFKLGLKGFNPAWMLYWNDSVETLEVPIKK